VPVETGASRRCRQGHRLPENPWHASSSAACGRRGHRRAAVHAGTCVTGAVLLVCGGLIAQASERGHQLRLLLLPGTTGAVGAVVGAAGCGPALPCVRGRSGSSVASARALLEPEDRRKCSSRGFAGRRGG
jgi:hypothetical protein